jgi:hypothetical protein
MNDHELSRALSALADEHDPADVDFHRLRETVTLRRRRRRAVTSTALGVTVLITGLILVTRSVVVDHVPTAVTPAPGQWTPFTVAGLNPADSAFLSRVVAVSDTDAWAVGTIGSSKPAPVRVIPVQPHSESPVILPPANPQTNLAVHWDGRQWQQSNVRGGTGLADVVAIAANDVWTVGTGQAGDGGFTAHWNGHDWSAVTSPTPNGLPRNVAVTLAGVAARTADDVWAVGCVALNGGFPIIQHWNGHVWQNSPLPSLSKGAVNCLNAVAVVSANDVWAVGTATGQYGDTPVALHWNGQRWSVAQIAGSFGAATVGGFDRVIALSATNVWAFGGWIEFAQHWDGRQWTHVPGPSGSDFQATAAAANGRDGLLTSTLPEGGRTALNLFSWDGETWTNQPGPPLAGKKATGQITGFSVAPGSKKLWAVGLYSPDGGNLRPLISLTTIP